MNELKIANKTIKKAKENDSRIKFSPVGPLEKIKVLVYSDASYLTIEGKAKSVAGKLIFLSSEDERVVSPLLWKSKTIPQVCKSAKSAETRAVDSATDDGLFLARSISEIYTGRKGRSQIPMIVKSDSKSLKDSLNSTKQVEEKMMRPVVQHIKDMITRREITSFDWVDSKSCHADILTKKSAGETEKVLNIIKTGKNILMEDQ